MKTEPMSYVYVYLVLYGKFWSYFSLPQEVMKHNNILPINVINLKFSGNIHGLNGQVSVFWWFFFFVKEEGKSPLIFSPLTSPWIEKQKETSLFCQTTAGSTSWTRQQILDGLKTRLTWPSEVLPAWQHLGVSSLPSLPNAASIPISNKFVLQASSHSHRNHNSSTLRTTTQPLNRQSKLYSKPYRCLSNPKLRNIGVVPEHLASTTYFSPYKPLFLWVVELAKLLVLHFKTALTGWLISACLGICLAGVWRFLWNIQEHSMSVICLIKLH